MTVIVLGIPPRRAAAGKRRGFCPARGRSARRRCELFDFDQVLDRRATQAKKWLQYPAEALPFWVADMDFPTPPVVIDAISERLQAGPLGYTLPPPDLGDLALDWLDRHHGYRPPAQALVWLPGVVPGLNVAARCLAEPGSALLWHTPIYYPFRDLARNTGQSAIEVALIRDGNRWVCDLDAMDHALRGHNAVALFLANPQNPTARAYSAAELEALAEFALRHNLVIVSDEIHSPLILGADCRHHAIAAIAPEVEQRTITLHAMTKGYNTAGTNAGVAIITDPELRKRFSAARAGFISNISPLAFAAAGAAYGDRSGYLDALLAVLRRNAGFVADTLARFPDIATTPVEATYLAWFDCRALLARAGVNLAASDRAVESYFLRHGLALSDGAAFGAPGFARFNFAAPEATLREGLARLQTALSA